MFERVRSTETASLLVTATWYRRQFQTRPNNNNYQKWPSWNHMCICTNKVLLMLILSIIDCTLILTSLNLHELFNILFWCIQPTTGANIGWYICLWKALFLKSLFSSLKGRTWWYVKANKYTCYTINIGYNRAKVEWI